MNFNYFIPTRILFGKGQLGKLHEQSLPGKKALIVTTAGNSVKKFGYLKKLEDQLNQANVEHVLFDKILPNPIKPHVMEGAKLAKEAGCDFIIGLGGGSSIDSAKSIAVMATNDGDYWDYIGDGTGKGKAVPKIGRCRSWRLPQPPGPVRKPTHGPSLRMMRPTKRSVLAMKGPSRCSPLSIRS